MKDKKKSSNKIVIIICGCLIGFVNGLLGGGGGMLCVPMLEKSLHLSAKESHATALAVMLPLCVVSSGVYLYYSNIDYNSLWIIMPSVILGGIAGAFLLKKLNSRIIRLVFAVLVLVVGIRILVG